MNINAVKNVGQEFSCFFFEIPPAPPRVYNTVPPHRVPSSHVFAPPVGHFTWNTFPGAARQKTLCRVMAAMLITVSQSVGQNTSRKTVSLLVWSLAGFLFFVVFVGFLVLFTPCVKETQTVFDHSSAVRFAARLAASMEKLKR